MHLVLDLLHRGPVCKSMQMPQHRPAVHWMLLLGPVLEQGLLMPSPTTARGFLGHLLHGADPHSTNQHASPPPVRSPTSSSLRSISAAGAGGRGARGGASDCRSPRDGGGEGRGAGGRNRYGEEMMSGEPGAKTRTTVTTGKTAVQARGGRGQKNKHDQVSSDRAGGEYRAGGAYQEESADKSAKWSGLESEGSETEAEAATMGEAGEKARRGQQQNRVCRTAEQESYLETRRPAGKHREGHLCSRRQDGSGGSAMGRGQG